MQTLKQRFSSMSMLGLIFVLLVILMSILLPNRFLRLSNFQSIAFQLPELGLLALAMMIAMISGGINLSIIASANFSGIIMAMIMTGLISDTTSGAGVFGISLLAIVTGLLV
ncbi:MAG: ABC transporter permease, partial [Bacillota bacterium]